MSDEKRITGKIPRPVDVEGALAEAHDLLTSIGAGYALIGGVALAVYGIERFTKDVDLAVSVETSGKTEAAKIGRELMPLRIGGISIVTASGVRVDLIDHRFEYRGLFEEAIQAAEKRGPLANVNGRQVPVVPLSYLVAMKLGASRPVDERDVLSILQKQELDYGDARDIVRRHLGPYAAKQLDRMAREVGRLDAPKDYSQKIS